jgi:hypothetical protein
MVLRSLRLSVGRNKEEGETERKKEKKSLGREEGRRQVEFNEIQSVANVVKISPAEENDRTRFGELRVQAGVSRRCSVCQ